MKKIFDAIGFAFSVVWVIATALGWPTVTWLVTNHYGWPWAFSALAAFVTFCLVALGGMVLIIWMINVGSNKTPVLPLTALVFAPITTLPAAAVGVWQLTRGPQ